jgi:hypothetical protein
LDRVKQEDTVKERPILFSAPMVRAILADTKTETRRPVKIHKDVSPDPLEHWSLRSDGYWTIQACRYIAETWEPQRYAIKCPYGAVGDKLWVRETWAPKPVKHGGGVAYRADGDPRPKDYCPGLTKGWRPSIFMPRWASRLTLEITEVLVRRLQDMDLYDCEAEGFEFHIDGLLDYMRGWDTMYRNKPEYQWKSNPWVWGVRFVRL